MRPTDDQIREVMLAGIPLALDRHGVSVESPVSALIHALEDLDPACLHYVPVASLLRYIEQRNPGYLGTLGQDRLRSTVADDLIDVVIAMYDRYELHPQAGLDVFLSCMRDTESRQFGGDLQVLDLALGFITQGYQTRIAVAS